MFKIVSSFLSSFLIFSTALAEEKALAIPQCEIFYLTKSDLSRFKMDSQPISSLSRDINSLLKNSFDVLNALDRYTLGLASTITLSVLLKQNASLEDIKPNAWNQTVLNGSLVYQDTPYSMIPVKAAKLKIQFEDNSQTLVTGTRGEFNEYFYKWITYKRFRLFPHPIFERKQKLVQTLKLPFQVSVDSKVCQASTTLHQLPLEPITFVLVPKK